LRRLGTDAMRLCAFAPLREIKNATLFEIIFLKLERKYRKLKLERKATFKNN